MKIKINKYRYDLDKDAQEYEKLCKTLKAQGFKKSETLSFQWSEEFYASLPEEGTIETEYLFENQYNIENHRVHDWAEAIFPNKKIKEGYYISGDLDELAALKREHYVCGFCGNRHQGHDAPLFCPKCIGDRYLKEEDLNMTVMQPLIGDKRTPDNLPVEEYRAAQAAQREQYKIEKKKRLAEKAERLKRYTKDKIESLKIDLQAQLNCIENSIDPSEYELIYYDHTKCFKFGYSLGLTREQSEDLRSADLNFDYEIELKDGTKR